MNSSDPSTLVCLLVNMQLHFSESRRDSEVGLRGCVQPQSMLPSRRLQRCTTFTPAASSSSALPRHVQSLFHFATSGGCVLSGSLFGVGDTGEAKATGRGVGVGTHETFREESLV